MVEGNQLWSELWWLLPLVFLKPLMTSITLAGGGSGGIFAPSLYLGATLGACIGLAANLLFPEYSNSPGVYAIVGMGAVVAGTTHGVLSAILIVYEMTGNYQVILPIMIAAGLASLVSRSIEPESIYYKKLSRRGGSIARGHDLHRLDHIMVRDVMIRQFPSLKHTDTVPEIVRVARENAHIEGLPVMDGGQADRDHPQHRPAPCARQRYFAEPGQRRRYRDAFADLRLARRRTSSRPSATSAPATWRLCRWRWALVPTAG